MLASRFLRDSTRTIKSSKITLSNPARHFSAKPVQESYKKNLSFFLNGKRVEVDQGIEPDTTLIEFLRGKGLTGSKLTCGEGGCGACTVTLSQYDKVSKNISHRSANSCLVPVCYVDGMEVTTVEGVGSVKNGLHPVQERLALFGGSQCGFCTPGFIMSMYTALRNDPNPKDALAFQKNLDGNLCRCTGYRPILDAAKTFCADTKDKVQAPQNRPFAPYNPEKERPFPEELKDYKVAPVYLKGSRSEWFAPTTLSDILSLKKQHPHARIVSGNTELGIEWRYRAAQFPVLISPINVPELTAISVSGPRIEIGSAVTLSNINNTFHHAAEKFSAKEAHKIQTLEAVTNQLHYFAGTPIRNVATIGGNIVNASPISDLNPVLVALKAEFKISSTSGTRVVPADKFFLGYKRVNMQPDEVLVSVSIPYNEAHEYVESYKQSKRRDDDIAIVTGAVVAGVKNNKWEDVRIALGGMATTVISAPKTAAFLAGKPVDMATVDSALPVLKAEVGLSGDPPGGMAEYRTSLALSFFYKFCIGVMSKVAPHSVPKELSSATMKLYPPVLSFGKQEYELSKRGTSVGDAEPHLSAKKQTTGEALYTDDLPSYPNELKSYLYTSTRAHARIKGVDTTEALKFPGVIAIYNHKDVPGNNIWGDIEVDEELFASEYVLHYGQPIGVVVAQTEFAAQRAAKLVKIEYEDLPPVFSIDDAIKAGTMYPIKHRVITGDVEKAFAESDHVVEGSVNIAGQEQFYFESNVALAVPAEGEMTIYSSTQNLAKTQSISAKALGIPSNKVVAKLTRIGGGFGGKESRTIPFAMAAAIAAHHLNRPVRMNLERDLDMGITGGRHPFRGDYKIGFTKEGKITGAQMNLTSNGGISYDLSIPVLIRALLFCDGCYKIPAIKLFGQVAKTNLPSNTAFRGFGGPQGTMVAEAAVEHVARTLNKTVEEIREANMYEEGDLTYYGQPVTKNVKRAYEICKKSAEYDRRLKEIEEFNKNNQYRKRGMTLMPTKYGVAFNANFLNQGGALVNVYTDGTVLVTHGGVEMGQGLHTKVAQIVATELDIPLSYINIRETSTDKVPNASATAASMGSDIYGEAALNAAKIITARLAPYREKHPEMKFKDIVNLAYFDRVNLSAQGFFKSMHEGYDMVTGKGKPWRYFTSGTTCTEVEIDTLTGDHKILRADLVLDIGNTINPNVDIGQIEGAFLQGAGYVSIEEMVWGDNQHKWVNPRGRLASCGPGAYKIPAADDVPTDWRVSLLKDTVDPRYETVAVQSSKAVGEPPLLLGLSVFFALKEAIKAQRDAAGVPGYFRLDSPITSERVRMACVDKITKLVVGENVNTFQTKGSF